MNWRNVRLVFLREVRDQLRDRRTLFMIFVLPLLLYPALGIGMVYMQTTFTEQPKTIVLLGSEHLPEIPGHPLLQGSHFAPSIFERSGDAQKITVLTDGPPPADLDKRTADRRGQWVRLAQAVAPDLPPLAVLEDRLEDLNRQLDKFAAHGRHHPEAVEVMARRETLLAEINGLKKRLGARLTQSDLQLVVVIPPGFRDQVQKSIEAWEHPDRRAVLSEYPGPLIAFDNAVDKSQLTWRSVKEAFKTWETNILKSRLEQSRVPGVLTEPVHARGLNLALGEQESSSFWSKLLPALLVIMAMTGAFYPAIDLVAGEKERGTMETLLISPASRVEIVLGKFLTTMAFSCSTVLLNLTSMGLTGKHMISMVQDTPLAHRAGDLTLPSGLQMLWLLVLLMPLSALFSALCLALATLARSSKEGQYYLTPLLMVSMGMTVFCMSPGIDLTPRTAIYTVVPIANVALLLKGLLGPSAAAGPLYYMVGPVLLTSIAYSAAALWWAIDQFQREDVLFRDTEQFDLRLWAQHLLRDKEPTPTFSEALFCFVLIMLLQFLAMKPMQSALAATDPAHHDQLMLQLLMVQQLAVIATPALMMGVMLITHVRRTFRLAWPSPRFLAIAVVLPLALHPLSWELMQLIPWPEPAQGVKSFSELMSRSQQHWGVMLLVFALTPAVCEELAFRGFILSGFARAGRMRVGILLTSVAFGLMHMIPQQVFNATLIGIVLGILAVRSHSLLPCVLFHFVNNALGVGMSSLAEHIESPWVKPFVLIDAENQVRYSWLTLAIALSIAGPALWWLVSRPAEQLQRLTGRRLGSFSPKPPAMDAAG